MQKRKLQIGIIGPEKKNLPKNNSAKTMLDMSFAMGKQLAQAGAILITGGCSGVMEAACRGAFENGGITVGTPGRNRLTSNDFVTVEICTPMDVGDYLFAGILSADVIIVLPGDAGTIAELAIAYRYRKPLIFIKDFGESILGNLFDSLPKDYPSYVTLNAKEAVDLAIKIAEETLI
ncbi:MAG: hypothetical protein WC465_03500 [Patescibacteria group bacterium]